ncbi:hypothetical protein GCM10009799_27720 [Nocardiopsis rhodophaea]|uniref:Ketosynthase family 3 (KS3) domain-containing protein n=1 Tax=Nocardiopsis rhodophaea TaxID=280238 RepID=A0ABP5EIM3_9ACTN
MSAPTNGSGVAVAVTGMSCRLPGGISTPGELWDALVSGHDLVTDTPAPDEQRSPSLFPAGLLDHDDFHGFDSDHFGLSSAEVDLMDPQQKWLCELVDEALQDAGVAPASLRGTNTGVWVGSAAIDQAILGMGPGYGTVLNTLGAVPSVLASRISYHFDLRGPSLTIDTACSASLVAVHTAMTSLRAGEVDMAIVGGASVMLTDSNTLAFRASGMLGSEGRCRPFDADADGFVRAEGAAVVVLQRVDDARASGAPIRAVSVGSGVNSDGCSRVGIVRPSPQGQSDLLRRVYERAGVDPAAVDYVQAHGTGTRDGDSVEVQSLGDVLGRAPGRKRPLLLGAVKANLGHAEGAAGIVGLISTVLAQQHGTIPPVIHHAQPREGLVENGLEVPTRPRPWPMSERRLAGVGSYGFGGTNAHVILEPPVPVIGTSRTRRRTAVASAGGTTGASTATADSAGTATAQLVPVSASTPVALAGTARRWAAHIRPDHDLRAIAATAAHRRDHHRHRAAVVADTPDLAREALEALSRGQEHPALIGPRSTHPIENVVFVFSGYGAQWARMGERLAATEPAFAAARDEANEAIADHMHRAPWTPGEPLRGIDTIQPALFAAQVGLAALWRAWGIEPDTVVGHSLGEAAASHTAGALSLDDTARLVVERSKLLAPAVTDGGLMATDLDPETAERVAAQVGATVAAYNGPRATVLAGPPEAVTDLHAQLTASGAHARVLDDAPAGHSPLIAHSTPRLEAALTGLRPQAAQIAMWSTATGAPIDGTDLDAAYWGDQLRAPVLLHPTVAALAAEGRCLFVEISPRPVLAAALTDTLVRVPGYDPADAPVVAATRPAANVPRDEHAELLRAVAAAATHGRVPAWPAPVGLDALDLPPRCWARPDAEHDDTYSRAVAAVTDAATDEDRDEAAARLLLGTVAVLIGRPEQELAFDAPLYELGVGSLDVYRLRARIRAITGTDAPVVPDTTLADLVGVLTAWAVGQPGPRTADPVEDRADDRTDHRTTKRSRVPG